MQHTVTKTKDTSSPLKTRVKICGITNTEDAQLCANAGADAIGLVFYENSPRHLADLGLAKEIAQAAGPFVNIIALTVDMEASKLEAILESVPIHVLQFHGQESPSFCNQFGRPYVKAVRMHDDIDVSQLAEHYNNASGILLDTYVKGIPGGTGESFNWDRVPLNLDKPLILAGGLNPNNVNAAIKVAEPYAVDVSSGVESAVGEKDPEKIIKFIRKVKAEYMRD